MFAHGDHRRGPQSEVEGARPWPSRALHGGKVTQTKLDYRPMQMRSTDRIKSSIISVSAAYHHARWYTCRHVSPHLIVLHQINHSSSTGMECFRSALSSARQSIEMTDAKQFWIASISVAIAQRQSPGITINSLPSNREASSRNSKCCFLLFS